MTDKYEPSEELKQYLAECQIQSYRLVDGSYVIAEEIDHDTYENVLYVASPLQLEISMLGKTYLRPWLDTENDDLVQLAGDKIVGRSDTPFELKLHYHRYFLADKLKDVLTPKEMESVMKDLLKPPVDKQDLTEEEDTYYGEEWKVDNGIDDSEGLQEDKGFDSISDIHLEWRKKFKGNN